MCHFRALVGDPGYDLEKGMEDVVRLARQDLIALQNGGVDGVMFSNEFSLPYLTKVENVTPVSMARIIGELKSEITIPYGVNVLWDPIASLDLAAATGARFIREIISGVYASDFGLWNTNSGAVSRHRHRLCPDVKMLYNIVPEAASYLSERVIEDIAVSTEFNCKPDGICVSGLIAGAAADEQVLAKVKKVVKHTPIFCNTGVKLETVDKLLSIADGAIVGTTFKQDGVFANYVDEKRVVQFMKKVREVRE
jgi:hypothetical protein